MRNSLICLLLFAASLLCGGLAYDAFQRAAAEEQLALELKGLRAEVLQLAASQLSTAQQMLSQEIAAARLQAFTEITNVRKALVPVLDRQLSDFRTSGISEIGAWREASDARLGDMLSEVQQLRTSVTPLVGSAAATLDGATRLMERYRLVPDELGAAAQPAYLALLPEVTCRTAAGDGYGGCWHSRVTALMGEAARVGGVFTQRFPEFSGSVTGIATDVHTFTSRAVAPRTFWQNVKDVLTTGSGVARAGAAAGLFQPRVRIMKYQFVPR